MDKVIFEYKTSAIIGIVMLLIAALPVMGALAIILSIWMGLVWGVCIVMVLIALYIYRLVTRDKSNFRIYNDRIGFFNPFWPEREMNIWMKDVFQARYEDRDRGYDAVGTNRILLYLKDDHTSDHRLNTKKNRIVLNVVGYREGGEDVISILKIFQAQGKQIYILTRSKKIKNALGLENWDLSK